MDNSGNREDTSFLKNGVVDNYFAMKLLEARREGDTERERFLLASQRSWTNGRSLHLGMAQDIYLWYRESERMDRMMDTQNLYRPDVKKKDRLKEALSKAPVDPVLVTVLVVLLTGAVTCAVLRIDWAASLLFGLDAAVSAYALWRVYRVHRIPTRKD